MTKVVKINYDEFFERFFETRSTLKYVDPMYWVYRGVKELLSSSQFTKNDSQNIAELIKAGKENGVNEMEITSNKLTGLDLKMPNVDADIKVSVGAKNETIIKIKYK